MKELMDYVKKQAEAGESFNTIFNRVTGWMDSEVRFKPNETHTVQEVRDLFDLLFEIKVSAYEKETPDADGECE